MIAMASHVGNIRESKDCQLLQLLLPADQQVNCMPHSSYGTCGWLHLFMHPIFQLEGEALTILEHDFKDVAFRSEHTPEAYRQEAILQSMRTLYLDVMNAHEVETKAVQSPYPDVNDILHKALETLPEAQRHALRRRLAGRHAHA